VPSLSAEACYSKLTMNRQRQFSTPNGFNGFNPAMSVKRALSKAIHVNGEGQRSSSPGGSGSGSRSPEYPNSPVSGYRRSIATYLFEKDYVSSSDNESDNYDSDGMSKNAAKRQARKAKRESKSRMSLESREESEERVKKRLEEAAKTETEEMKARYGPLPLMQSTARATENRIDIDTITEEMVDQELVFRARLHHVRSMGAKLVFLILRQQISTLQAVLVEQPGMVSELMLHWAEHLRTGSVVRVKGIVQKPDVPVKSASIHNLEIKVTNVHLITARKEPGTSMYSDIQADVLMNNSSVLCLRSRDRISR
jgi:ergosteryl-3beta-O-L-aspartate synthase